MSGAENAVAYAYDLNGNALSKTNTVSGEASVYTYNSLNQKLTAAEVLNGEVWQSAEYTYDLVGNLLTDVTVNNEWGPLTTAKSYTYDALNRLTGTVSGDEAKSYVYDSLGNMLKEINNDGADTVVSVYEYNEFNQLLAKAVGDTEYTYAYDARGNLVSEAKDGVNVKTYAYNAANKMVLGINLETGEQSGYTYDALGNRVSLERTSANPNVDVVNNMPDYGKYGSLLAGLALEGIDTDTGNGQKTYSDNFGLTRETEKPAVYTDFVVDYNSVYNNEIMAYEAGSYTTKYVYGGSEKLWQTVIHAEDVTDTDFGANANTDVAVEEIGTAFYHLDRLGSTAFVTTTAEVDDGNGGVAVVSSVLAYAQYDEWGNVTSQTAVYGEADVYAMNAAGAEGVQSFTGYEYDQIIEKYYAKARLYDPLMSRMISPDPNRQGYNYYTYSKNNPLIWTDPTGLTPVSIRSYVESRGGYAIAIESARVGVFGLNDRTLKSSYDGGRVNDYWGTVNITNVGGYLSAEPSELYTYFYGISSSTSGSGSSLTGGSSSSGGGSSSGVWSSGGPSTPNPTTPTANSTNIVFTNFNITLDSYTFSLVSSALIEQGIQVAPGVLEKAMEILGLTAATVVSIFGIDKLADYFRSLSCNDIVYDPTLFEGPELGDDLDIPVAGDDSSTIGNSGKLRRNLKKAGIPVPPFANNAHHIVAALAAAAKPARDIIFKVGIGINDAINGVFLEISQHQQLHTNVYYNAVNEALKGLTTRTGVENALREIANKLMQGVFPH